MITELAVLTVIGLVTFIIYITCTKGKKQSSDGWPDVQVHEIESKSEVSTEVDLHHHTESFVLKGDIFAENHCHHGESFVLKDDLSVDVDHCYHDESLVSKGELSVDVDHCYHDESLISTGELSVDVDHYNNDESLVPKGELSVDVDHCYHDESLVSTGELSVDVDHYNNDESLVPKGELSVDVDHCYHDESLVSTGELSVDVDHCYHDESLVSKGDLSVDVDHCYHDESLVSTGERSVDVDHCYHDESLVPKGELSVDVDHCYHDESLVPKGELSVDVDHCYHDESLVPKGELSVDVDHCYHDESLVPKGELSVDVDHCYHDESLVSTGELSVDVDHYNHDESLVSKGNLSADVDHCHLDESPQSKDDLSSKIDYYHHDNFPVSKGDTSVEVDYCKHDESLMSKSVNSSEVDLSAEWDHCHHEKLPISQRKLSADVDHCKHNESLMPKSDISSEVDPHLHDESRMSKSYLADKDDPRHHNESLISSSDLSAMEDLCGQNKSLFTKEDEPDEVKIESKVSIHEPSPPMPDQPDGDGAVATRSATGCDLHYLDSNTAASSMDSEKCDDARKKERTLHTTHVTNETGSEKFSNMKRIAEQTLSRLNYNTYVKTRAHYKAEDMLFDVGIVVLVGSPGSGKTTLGLHLMAHIRDLRNRKVVIVDNPSLLEDLHIPEDLTLAKEEDKLVVLFDDIFGRSNLIDEYVQTWELKLPTLWHLIKVGFIKVIITCRSQIFSECENNVNEFDVFKLCHQINLHDPTVCLTTDEKRFILDQHLNASTAIENTLSEKDKDLAVMLTFKELGFPQCCNFYVNSPDAQTRGLEYFRNPIEYLKSQLNKLKVEKKSQFHYLVLLVLMFKQGKLDEQCLDPFEEDTYTLDLIKILKHVCSINTDVSLGQIKASAKSLCGVYLEHYDGNKTYRFIHQSVFDTLFMQFSAEYPKQSIAICPVSMLLQYVVTSNVITKGAIKMVVDKTNYKFLAHRFTNELKGTRRSNVKTILSHPSFKDEEFLEFMIEDFWNNDVPSEILCQKFDAEEIKTDVVFQKTIIESAWENVQNRELDDVVLYDARTVARTDTTVTPIAILTSPGSIAVIKNLNTFSKHFVFSLCKADSSDFEQHRKEILDVACFVGNSELVDILLRSGTAPTKSSFTAAAASKMDNVDILTNLVKHKNDLKLNVHDLGSMVFLAIEKENGNISSALIDEVSKMENRHVILENAVKQLLLQCHRDIGYLIQTIGYNTPQSTRSSRIGAGNLFRKLFSYTGSLKLEVLVFLAAAHDDATVLKELLNRNPLWCNSMQGRKHPLHAASYYGCVESVTFLIEKGCNISAVNVKQQTALHLAAMYNTPDIVQCLLSYGADPNVQDTEDNSPLHFAASKGSLNSVKALVEKGAKLNIQNANGKTPLHMASNEKGILMYLLQKGAGINLQDNDGRTPLHMAAQWHATECVKCLVENGSKVNVRDTDGMTPLLVASRAKIVSYLLLHEADPFVRDADENTALHMAVYMSTEMNYLSVGKLFIEKGVNVNAKNRHDQIPLHIAAKNSSLQMVRYLVEEGSQINLLDGQGMSPLYLAVKWSYDPIDIVVYLLRKGANPNLIGKHNEPMLHLALMKGYLELTKTLVLNKVNLNTADTLGMMPLHSIIKQNGNKVLQFVKCLVENGSNVNEKNKGCTPLHLAITVRRLDVCLYLLDKGADTNATDVEQNTPLHLAVSGHFLDVGYDIDAVSAFANSLFHLAIRAEHLKLVKLLVEKGAKLNITDASGNTPLHIAAQYNSVDTVRYLVEKGSQIDLPNSNGIVPLQLAARYNTSEVCSFLLNKGADINVKDAENKSPLHVAVCNTHLNVVEHFIQRQTKVDSLDKFGNSPLHIAATKGSLETVTSLTKMGSQTNLANSCGMLPFHLALQYNSEDVSLYLLDKTSHVNLVGSTEMDSPLHFAARKRSIRLVKTLVESGANVNEMDSFGRTPLLSMMQYYSEHASESRDPLECMQYLLSRGSQVNTTDCERRTPLHIAAEFCSLECVKCLVQNASNINAMDNSGSTPLHKALGHYPPDTSVYLLEHGADPNVKDGKSMSPLHLVTMDGYLVLMNALVNKGANINATDSNGNTPLHLAVEEGSIQNVRYLVGKGSEINKANNRENSPLHIAVRMNQSTIAFYLLSKGADPNTQNAEKISPLHLSAKTNLPDFIAALVTHGAKLNAVDICGESALHTAVRYNRLNNVRCLVEKGSDINLANSVGITPLNLAQSGCLSSITEYLLSKGASPNVKGSNQAVPAEFAIVVYKT